MARTLARMLIASIALTLMLGGTASAQQPTLTGELLAGFSFLHTTGTTCSESGSTIQFDTSGPAAGGAVGQNDPDLGAGPYPGTFTASGTIVSTPNTLV